MTEKEVEAIFTLAHIAPIKMHQIMNKYSGDPEDPWWLVQTTWGMIEIGWRKRVINIDWSDTPLRIKKGASREYEFHMLPLISADSNITHEAEYIHAWSFGAAVDYLTEFRHRMGQWTYATSPEGVVDLAERKKKYEERAREVADNARPTCPN
jgi:hypothetical protein